MSEEKFTDEPDGFEDLSDEGYEVVELTDDDGMIQKFFYLATIKYGDSEYAVLEKCDPEDGEYDDFSVGEIYVFKFDGDETDENGESAVTEVQDEELREAILEAYYEGLEDYEEDESAGDSGTTEEE